MTENSVLALYWCNDTGIANLIEGGNPKEPTLTIDLTQMSTSRFLNGLVDTNSGSITMSAGKSFEIPMSELSTDMNIPQHGNVDISWVTFGTKDWSIESSNISYYDEQISYGYCYYFKVEDLSKDALVKIVV